VHSPDIDYILQKSKAIRNVADPVLQKTKLSKLTEKDGHTSGKKFQLQLALLKSLILVWNFKMQNDDLITEPNIHAMNCSPVLK
jgi:hypothetical protein